MNIHQHFRPEEHEFIDQVIEWKRLVEETYSFKLTDFLDPRSQHIIQTIIGESSDIRCLFFGGFENAERKRALFVPEYYSIDVADFQIRSFEIDYPSKFVTIEHPQVLGSLMSLGLKRDKFGDILVNDQQIQIIIAHEISSYIQLQLTSIGKVKVNLNEVPLEKLTPVKESWTEVNATVSSLRIDALVSTLYNISRQKSQALIEHGHVKVNFTLVDKTSFECKSQDIISVRGHGRTKIISLDGKTKKDKWRILAGKQK